MKPNLPICIVVYVSMHVFSDAFTAFVNNLSCCERRKLTTPSIRCRLEFATNNQHALLSSDVRTSIDDIATIHTRQQQEEISEFYRSDPRDGSVAKIPEDGKLDIRQQLAQRYMARKERRYEVLQQIDEQLQAKYGIKVFDNPNIWTTQRTPPSSEFRKWIRKRNVEMKKQYGPTGHPYVRVGGPIDYVLCSMDITEIHTLLSRRTHCRNIGKYDEAESIKLELMLHGVRFDDDLLQWRADGSDEFNKEWSNDIPMPPRIPITYKQNEASQDIPEEIILQRVEKLVEQRSIALAREEILLAAFLSLELYKTYHVGVDDATHTWSEGCHFAEETIQQQWVEPEWPNKNNVASLFGEQRNSLRYLPIVFDSNKEHRSPSYQPSDSSRKVDCPYTLHRITELVQERIHKREEHHFKEADGIRRELWATYHVGVNDRLRQWSVGGVFELPVVS